MLAVFAALCGTADAGPLAIPADQPAVRTRNRRPPPPSAEDVKRIETYQAKKLAVYNVADFYAGTTYVSHSYGWWPWGGVSVGYTPTYRYDTWAVFEGSRRLEVPEYLGMVGRTKEMRRLDSRIRRNNVTAIALYTTGVVGAIATIGGLVQMEIADSQLEYDRGVIISSGGTLAMLTGFLTGAIPVAQSRRLRARPDASRDYETVQADVAAYNERLRETIGLTPEQALQADQQ